MDAVTPIDAAPFFDERKRAVLAQALKESFDMSEEDASEVAVTVAEQFGENVEVNDEELDPSVRSIFYTLESKKILSFRREEYTWEDGQRRRGFWWRVREEELRRIQHADESIELDIYDSLPKSVWESRQNA